MLVVEPTHDGPRCAEAVRRSLQVPRRVAIALGVTAVEALERGVYEVAGVSVSIRVAVDAAIARTRSLPPDAELPQPSSLRHARTRVRVTNETTLEVARRLADEGRRPLALNFADAVEPGGGFLSGARAQEETLCRSSALYATLRDDAMYAAHRRRPQPDATDWVILSPDVPVFRLDDGTPLPQPWPLSFLTCAAPYAPGIGLDVAGDLLASRIERVLAVAHAFQYDTLVLGAWGCGAFGNDPSRTARDTRDALAGPFAGAFSQVVFAIADWSEERRFLGPFRDAFEALERPGE